MRVLHVVVAGEIGGAERMLVDLASPTSTSTPTSTPTHVVALWSGSDAVRDFFRSHVDVIDMGVHRETPLTYLSHSLGVHAVDKLRAAIRDTRAQIVQLHTIGTHVLGTRAAMREGAKILRTEHSTRAYDDPSVIPFSSWSLRRADAIACVSQSIARTVARAHPADAARTTVIQNGVDLARFSPLPFPPRSRFTFAMVGRLDPRKGIDLALEALTFVPDAHLVIAGEGSERAHLEALSESLGVTSRVEFLGRVDHPRDVHARANAMLCTSRKEALGLALLEGMASGRPVVAVPTGGVTEFVKHETGYLADDGTPWAIARAMRVCMQDAHCEARTARGVAIVREHYSLVQMRAGYRALYERLTSAT